MQKSPQKFLEDTIRYPAWKRRVNYLLRLSLFSLTFYSVVSLNLLLEEGQRGMLPIPLSAGFSLAVLTLFGIRLWPGIIIGTFAVKLPIFSILTEPESAQVFIVPFIMTAFEAIGEVLQTLIAVGLLNHLQFRETFLRVYDVLLLTIVTILIAPLLGASFSSFGLFLAEGVPTEFIGEIWLIDWLSNGVGMLVLTPTLLVWRQLPPQFYTDLRSLEWSFLLLCLAVVSGLTLKTEHGDRLLLLYMILPFAVWAALRFEQHGATLAALLVTGILLNGGLNRIIEPDSPDDSIGIHDVILEIGFIGITSFTAFMVAAAATEQRLARENLVGEQAYLRVVLQTTSSAIIVVDTKGYVTYLNPMAQQLTGYTEDQALGRSIGEIFWLRSLYFKETIEQLIKQSLKGKKLHLKNYVLFNLQKKEININLSLIPIQQTTTEIIGVVITCMPITGSEF